ncbi:hypothetical protein Pcinc_000781 [Petrolisthes cinctipes]|uniref:Polysaccharide lyase family 8 central domain-containing protein n=1 Tax=Petrolisthes cinctipes TaxID=88211 RepID=A0AAE1GLI0_PETCI|nr:hypothetical protein Pcinc_000781 [Petrolisthes cinctipes]
MRKGDGFLTVVVDGSELGSEGQEVFMVYDWAKVPGVTNLYTTDIPQSSLYRTSLSSPQYQTSTYWAERCMNNAEFAGGVTDGVVGLASMDYNRPHVSLTALKSWFFFEDVIVVVGSRISLSEDDATGENVITTLAQGQPKRRSESVLSTSCPDGVEPGDEDSTSPDPSTSDVHHSKWPRLGAFIDEDPQQHPDPIPGLPGVGVSTVGTPAGTATLPADSTLFTPTNQPQSPSVLPHYSRLPPLIPREQFVMYGGEHVLGKTNGEETILGLGETQHLSPAYLHHHSVGYVFIQGEENLTVSAAMKTLSSNELEVFTAWLNHGTAPSDSLLAYAILPSADLVRTRAFHASPEVELVEVSSYNHIVCHRPSKTIGGSIGTVGSISTPTCGEAGPMTLDVDTPCLVLLTLISDTLDQAQFRIALSDPQQQFVHINLMLKYGGRSTSAQVTLPPPPKSGDSVFLFLSV